ncbi:SPOR domain-containing protein, partial [Sphingomonas bacterium]|uniref:SPOR domain-containing protein n=1 Tax=Sphingomonas bacterium TaxID=1895847 RepID=UPI001C2D24F6
TIRSQPSVTPPVTSAAIGAGVPAAAATPPAAAPAAIPAQSSSYAPPTTIALPPSRPTATASAPALVPSGGWRIQIAAVASPEAAESEWKRLSAKVPALADLGHAAVPAGALTRLQATGLASRADAGALCQQMVAVGLGCFVVAPGP